MPRARRKALLARAQAGLAVVEDDYEFEMSFAGAPRPRSRPSTARGRVIYIGSFSKSVFPGARLGYLVADPCLPPGGALRGMMLRHPPGHMQRTLAHFLSLGHYDAQANRMRRAYAWRRAVMLESISAHGLRLASPGCDRRVKPVARDAAGGRCLASGTGAENPRRADRTRRPLFCRPAEGAGLLPATYSSISAERIPEGIRRIAQAMSEVQD
ncbi:MAG: hypothetical protein U1E55_03005 [Paracoccus sp. (in: a-proteobacteria)]